MKNIMFVLEKKTRIQSKKFLQLLIIFILVGQIISCFKKKNISLEDSALVVVDLQTGRNPGNLINTDTIPKASELNIPKEWADAGVNAEDVIKAMEFGRDHALPNSIEAVKYFRDKKRPIIYIRWGSSIQNALDMEPTVRKYHVMMLGVDPSKWGLDNIVVDARLTSVAPGIEVVKTAHDAFISSNIDFVLKNLNIKTIFLIGGHTNACYLTTAQSAKKKGYTIVSLEDATTDAVESRRLKGIEKAKFDYVIKTEELTSEKFIQSFAK